MANRNRGDAACSVLLVVIFFAAGWLLRGALQGVWKSGPDQSALPAPAAPLSPAARPPANIPPERGAGAGVVSDDLQPVRGEPVRNAARAAEIDRRAREYRREYSKFGIDGK